MVLEKCPLLKRIVSGTVCNTDLWIYIYLVAKSEDAVHIPAVFAGAKSV